MKINKKDLKQVDFLLIGIVFAITLFGLVAIANATADALADDQRTFWNMIANMNCYYVRLQLMWFASGLLLLSIAAVFDYGGYAAYSKYIYWANVGLLVLLLVLGEVTRGAQGWFTFFNGERGFQPSEFCKISLILMLARVFANKPAPIGRIRDLVSPLAYTLIPFAIVVYQNDFGTAMVYVIIFFGMQFAAQVKGWIIGGEVLACGAMVPLIWNFVLQDYQKNRILDLIDPTRDPTGSGLQVTWAKTAVGSGQITGKGLFRSGALSELNYVPDAHTDFIFSVTAEAVGFLGCLILVALFVFLMWRMIHIARYSRDRVGSLIVAGVVSMMGFHIFENIGMNIGIMPVTGIPLPFFSYGGSSMWTNLIAVGLVLNVAFRRQKKKAMIGGGEQ